MVSGNNISELDAVIEVMLNEIKIVVGGTGADPEKLNSYAEAIFRLTEAQINVKRLKEQNV